MAKSIIPAFPFPFDYCSVDRAARLFDCEVEDIWHLISIGSIQAYFDIGEAVRTSTINAGEIGEVIIYCNDKECLEMIDSPSMKWHQADYSAVSTYLFGVATFIEIGANSLGDDGKASKKPSGYFIDNGYGFEMRTNLPPLHGYWSVDLEGTQKLSNSEQLTVTEIISACGFISICFNHPLTMQADQLVLLRPDLELIHTHIHSGQPMPSYVNGGKIRPNENKVHGHTLAANEKELRFIEIAAEVLKKYPKTNTNGNTAFARAILRHASEFPQSGRLDYEEETIRKKLAEEKVKEKILYKSKL